MGALGRLTQRLAWRRASPKRVTHNWNTPASELPPRLSRKYGDRPAPPPDPEVKYPLDLDAGDIAMGYHLIARSISLTKKGLYFEYAFAPELTEDAAGEVWLNMSYDADISPPDFNYMGAGDEVLYARPPLAARYAWFDFFHPDFVWEEHHYGSEPDSEYLQNRISRLIFDLKTGEARIASD